MGFGCDVFFGDDNRGRGVSARDPSPNLSPIPNTTPTPDWKEPEDLLDVQILRDIAKQFFAVWLVLRVV